MLAVLEALVRDTLPAISTHPPQAEQIQLGRPGEGRALRMACTWPPLTSGRGGLSFLLACSLRWLLCGFAPEWAQDGETAGKFSQQNGRPGTGAQDLLHVAQRWAGATNPHLEPGPVLTGRAYLPDARPTGSPALMEHGQLWGGRHDH
ncbi:Protein Rrnad1 [Manis pentadactyla]|nr:Protein Rrnad1 [Manis pentadactyla]